MSQRNLKGKRFWPNMIQTQFRVKNYYKKFKVKRLFTEINLTIKIFKMFKFYNFFTFIDREIDIFK